MRKKNDISRMFKKNDKNSGLSEQERLQKALFDKKVEDSKYRMSMFIDAFREGYRQLVLKYGIKFIPTMKFDPLRGISLGMAEQECREELEAYHKAKEEESGVQTTQNDGVVKN